MTIGDKILERIEELHKDMATIKNAIIISETDIVSNQKYCEIRTHKGMPLKMRTLRSWFSRPGFPRYDRYHVSVSAVDKWVKEEFKP